MASQSYIFTVKESIPTDILLTMKEVLPTIFTSNSDWEITKNSVSFYYYKQCFDYKRELKNLSCSKETCSKLLTIYHYLCTNAELEVICNNPNDFEYGPSNIAEFKEQFDRVIGVAD